MAWVTLPAIKMIVRTTLSSIERLVAKEDIPDSFLRWMREDLEFFRNAEQDTEVKKTIGGIDRSFQAVFGHDEYYRRLLLAYVVKLRQKKDLPIQAWEKEWIEKRWGVKA